MASIKTVLDTRRSKADGTYPIAIRITHERKTRFIATGCSIYKKEWDEVKQEVKSNCPSVTQFNCAIHEIIAKLYKVIKSLSEQGSFSVLTVLAVYHNRSVQPHSTIVVHATKVIDEMKSVGKVGNAISYEVAVNQLKKEYGDLPYSSIDYQLLTDFEIKLRLKGLKTNSIAAYFRAIRALYNKAMKIGIAERVNYPFDKYSIKHEKTAKRAVAPELLKKVFAYSLKQNSVAWHWRNYFVLIFNLIGINFTDLVTLSYSDVKEGRVCFRRKKTGKLYNIKLTTTAKRILKLYEGQHSTYLLPVLPEHTLTPVEQKKLISEKLKQCNKYLKRIGVAVGLTEPLTTYVSRHSWATIAKQQGVSNEVIAEALGHEYGNKITGIYLDQFDLKVVDEANEKVTGVVS